MNTCLCSDIHVRMYNSTYLLSLKIICKVTTDLFNTLISFLQISWAFAQREIEGNSNGSELPNRLFSSQDRQEPSRVYSENARFHLDSLDYLLLSAGYFSISIPVIDYYFMFSRYYYYYYFSDNEVDYFPFQLFNLSLHVTVK